MALVQRCRCQLCSSRALWCDSASDISLHSLHPSNFTNSPAEMVKSGVIRLSSATAVHRQHIDTNHQRFPFLSVSTCSVNHSFPVIWSPENTCTLVMGFNIVIFIDLLVSWERCLEHLEALNDAAMEVPRAAGSLLNSNLLWHQGTGGEANSQNQAVLCNILFLALKLPLWWNTWTSCFSLLKSRPNRREFVQWDRCWFLFPLCNQEQGGILVPWQLKTHIDLGSIEVWDFFSALVTVHLRAHSDPLFTCGNTRIPGQRNKARHSEKKLSHNK